MLLLCSYSPLLQQLIEDDDDESREEKLADDQDSVTGSKGAKVSVHARDHVCHGFTDCDQDTEQLYNDENAGNKSDKYAGNKSVNKRQGGWKEKGQYNITN